MRVLRLAAVAAATLAVASCTVSAPPGGFDPGPSAAKRPEDLSGSYCYFGPEASVRGYRRSEASIPFVDVPGMASPTRVEVDASAERVDFTYSGSDGTAKSQRFEPARDGAAWRTSAFVITGKGPGSTFASAGSSSTGVTHEVASHGRESRLFRLADGRLAMTDVVRSKSVASTYGQGWFYSEEDAVVVLFEVATGGCASPQAARPSWFGQGLDLRNPACSVRLEEALVEILREQGESPGSARDLAATARDQLRQRAGGGRDFTASAGIRLWYRFEITGAGSGCGVRLVERSRDFSTDVNTVTGISRRALSDCVCNP
jgi:hypothetical protein